MLQTVDVEVWNAQIPAFSKRLAASSRYIGFWSNCITCKHSLSSCIVTHATMKVRRSYIALLQIWRFVNVRNKVLRSELRRNVVALSDVSADVGVPLIHLSQNVRVCARPQPQDPNQGWEDCKK